MKTTRRPPRPPQSTAQLDLGTLLTDLQAIGTDRARQEEHGGPLFAAFADFCWHAASPLTAGHFKLWLDMLTAVEVRDPSDVAAALVLLEVLP